MSRIIVKNLPKKINEKKLRELFESKGCITDFQLKYTKEGFFRQFAFIGYKTEEEAQSAKEYFHNTFINASKVQVELCTDLCDADKPKPWSKHSKRKLEQFSKEDGRIDSSPSELEKENKSKKKHNSKDGLGESPEEDELFAEFIELNKDRRSKPLWADDGMDMEEKVTNDSNDDVENKECNSSDDGEDNVAKNKNLTDMEYLKSKMCTEPETSMASEEKNNMQPVEVKKMEKVFDDCYTVKLRNLPYLCKKKDIKKFFGALKIESLRLPPKSKGFAYVKFKTEKDMNYALNKNKGILDGRSIIVMKYQKRINYAQSKGTQDNEDSGKNMEILAEFGRLFVRNLCFTVTEEELQELFCKFGPLAEIHVPIDSYTKRGLGYAFVSYVFAEHAVAAFTKLDGTIFQGRVLHIIPGKPKKENDDDIDDLPFKKKKEKKLKALSGSSHNWNTLFLGLNAVADAMVKKYNVDKSTLLNDEKDESIAVRMALGETQLVMETRKFLTENGVQLDAFSQPAAERSKTVIIAKNLPAGTSGQELYDVFSRHGLVSRVVLPPSGITALIEFQLPTEAKLAFNKLAYSKFHHSPLYLEWAPMNALKPAEPKSISSESKENKEQAQESAVQKSADVAEEDEDFEPEPGTTLFVRNINFATDEESLRKHFKKCGPLHSVTISKKLDPTKGKLLSMGFGFVQFKNKSSANQALQELQNSTLDGHNLELKFSNRATILKPEAARKKSKVQPQTSAKILVRNIPFEVSEKEIRDLFKEFGNLKLVRLPKKFSAEGRHRGFGFVEFTAKANAKRAFDALCHSTHLLGRRLVLEWANPNAEDVVELRKKTAKNFFIDGPKAKLRKSKLMEDVMLGAAKE